MTGTEVATWDLDAPVNDRLAYMVVEQMAFGRTLKEIALIEGFPPPQVFTSWVIKNPPLALAVAKAKELSSYAFEEDAIDMLREAKASPEISNQQLKAIDMLVQQLRWSAIKRNPQVFSEKAAVSMIVPVQINTSLDLGSSKLSQGTATYPNIYDMQAKNVIEVETTPMADPLPELEATARPTGAPRKRQLPSREVDTPAARHAREVYRAATEQKKAKKAAYMKSFRDKKAAAAAKALVGLSIFLVAGTLIGTII